MLSNQYFIGLSSCLGNLVDETPLAHHRSQANWAPLEKFLPRLTPEQRRHFRGQTQQSESRQQRCHQGLREASQCYRLKEGQTDRQLAQPSQGHHQPTEKQLEETRQEDRAR